MAVPPPAAVDHLGGRSAAAAAAVALVPLGERPRLAGNRQLFGRQPAVDRERPQFNCALRQPGGDHRRGKREPSRATLKWACPEGSTPRNAARLTADAELLDRRRRSQPSSTGAASERPSVPVSDRSAAGTGSTAASAAARDSRDPSGGRSGDRKCVRRRVSSRCVLVHPSAEHSEAAEFSSGGDRRRNGDRQLSSITQQPLIARPAICGG